MDYSKALTKYLRRSSGRKIILISEGVLGTYLMQTFQAMNVDVEDYYDIRETEEFVLPEKLVNKFDEYFVIVTIYSGHKRVVEELFRGGYTYIKDCAVSNESVYVEELDMVDPLLGYARETDNDLGFTISGEVRGQNDLTVLLLGNSTTDSSVGGLNCWGYYLFSELKNAYSKNIVIYNGGVAGYNSGQEFLKLCRDGLCLKPDIVISFGGVTDIDGIGTVVHGKKLVHQYQYRMWRNIVSCAGAIPDSLHLRNLKKLSTGMEETLSDADVWVNNERKMYAVCKEFGIKFIGCLQPLIATGCIIENEMKILLDDIGIREGYYETQREFINKVERQIKDGEYLKDLTKLFDDQDQMYYDIVHYSEKGNQLIAKAVKDIIVEEMGI